MIELQRISVSFEFLFTWDSAEDVSSRVHACMIEPKFEYVHWAREKECLFYRHTITCCLPTYRNGAYLSNYCTKFEYCLWYCPSNFQTVWIEQRCAAANPRNCRPELRTVDEQTELMAIDDSWKPHFVLARSMIDNSRSHFHSSVSSNNLQAPA